MINKISRIYGTRKNINAMVNHSLDPFMPSVPKKWDTYFDGKS